MSSRRRQGFTFIELLVSITIVAVLMAVAAVSYSDVNKRSRDSKRRADLETIRSALEICRANYGEYPDSITTNITCTQGGISTGDVSLNSTPVDPKSGAVYLYGRPTTTTYTLEARLELPVDPTVYGLTNP